VNKGKHVQRTAQTEVGRAGATLRVVLVPEQVRAELSVGDADTALTPCHNMGENREFRWIEVQRLP